MSLLLRITRYSLLALLALIVLLVVLLGWMLATESGSRWLIGQGAALAPGELTIGQVSGRLIRDLRLEQIHYRQGELEAHGESMALRWQPSRLFAGELLIEQLTLGDLDLRLPPPTEETAAETDTESPALPDQITLPLALELRELRLHRVTLHPYVSTSDAETADNETETTTTAQQLDGAVLSLSARDGRIDLRQLQLRSPQADLELSGQVGLNQGFPLELRTGWQLRLPAADVGSDTNSADTERPAPTRIDGQGALSGTLAQLQLQQSITGALQATLQASLDQLMSDAPQWHAQIQLDQVDLAQLLPQSAPELLALTPTAQLEAEGSFDSVQLSLQLAATLPELQRTQLKLKAAASTQRIEISALELAPEQGSTRLSATGQIDDPLGTRQLDVNLSWKALRYPLHDNTLTTAGKPVSPLVQSSDGQLTLRGTLDDYQLQLQAALVGQDLPSTQLNAQGQGDLEQLTLQPLRAETLGGTLHLDGQVRWTPQLSWTLDLAADGLQPEQHWPELPGRLSARIHTEGSLTEQLNALVRIDQLGGELQQQPLSGQGRLQITGTDVELEQIQLGWGETRLEASGAVAEQIAVDWRLRIPDLATLLPGAAGRIQGEGRLFGARQLPSIAANLSIAELAYETSRIEQLDAKLAFDPSWGTPADIRIDARQISGAGQQINSANLAINGTEQRLQIALDADAEPNGRLSLRADGQLRTDLQQTPLQWAWDGRISRLDLSNPQAGQWRLTAPSVIVADPRQYRLERLCLRPQDVSGRACVEASGSLGSAAPNAQASLSIDALSLDLFTPFIPDPTELAGRIDAQAQFELLNGQSRYSARVDLPKAAFSLPDSDLRLTLDTSQLTLQGDQNRADAQLRVQLDPLQGGIDGRLSIQDLGGAGRLSGALTAQIEQLRPLALLLPTVQIQAGAASAALNIGGQLSAPEVKGQLNVSEGDIELPAAGIRVTDIALRLEDDPTSAGRMRVSGQAQSGQGALALQGSLYPLEQRGSLTLRGERFSAMNTNEIQLLISPDLQLALSPQQIRVRGELLIPEALIQAPKLEQSAISASPDLVVRTEAGEPSAAGPALDIDMRVALGDSVWVDAFGFNGRLTGGLNLQQQGRGLARGTGSVGVASGQYRLYGQDLNISRGNVIFTGGPLSNPGLDLRVERSVDEVVVGALVGGTLRRPDLRLTSTPAMPDNRILSYLILGRAPDSASAGEQQMLMKLALSLGAKGGTSITEKLTQSLNVDEIGFSSGDTVDDTSFYIGKYLSPDLYIKYGIGLINPVNTFLMRYQLTKQLALETETSAEGSGGDLIYSFER